VTFEWDRNKEALNLVKHGVDFDVAKLAFEDSQKIIISDTKHSRNEPRYFCLGLIEGKVLTVRFTVRNGVFRIIGAGFWRGGKAIYEKANGKN
jgi:uncharacterized DUF497 family protein